MTHVIGLVLLVGGVLLLWGVGRVAAMCFDLEPPNAALTVIFGAVVSAVAVGGSYLLWRVSGPVGAWALGVFR